MSSEIYGRCLLKHLLHKKKLTPTELSEKTGISRTQISSYMANTRTMSLKNARLIAVTLDIHIDDLYSWSKSYK